MSRFAFLSRWKRPQTFYLQPETSFEDWCKQHRGSACHLVVSAHLTHEMTFEAGLPLRDEAEREAYARQQFIHYFGSVAQRWQLAVRPDGASALHGIDWTALQTTAKAHKVHLLRVEPFWGPLLRKLHQTEREWIQAPKAALAWVDGTHCSWIILGRGQVQSIRKLRLRDTSQAALDEALPSFDGPVQVAQADPQLLSGPGKEITQASFLPIKRRAPALAWGLLATSVVVLATAAWDARASYQSMVAARQRKASLESRSAASRPQAIVVATANKPDADTDGRAMEVQALLQLPWEPLLTRVEQIGAKGQVSWLGLDVNAGRRDLRLDGLAPDKLLALQLADRMGEHPGWQQVMLGRLQQADGGLMGQRFDISARFGPAISAKEDSK